MMIRIPCMLGLVSVLTMADWIVAQDPPTIPPPPPNAASSATTNLKPAPSSTPSEAGRFLEDAQKSAERIQGIRNGTITLGGTDPSPAPPGTDAAVMTQEEMEAAKKILEAQRQGTIRSDSPRQIDLEPARKSGPSWSGIVLLVLGIAVVLVLVGRRRTVPSATEPVADTPVLDASPSPAPSTLEPVEPPAIATVHVPKPEPEGPTVTAAAEPAPPWSRRASRWLTRYTRQALLIFVVGAVGQLVFSKSTLSHLDHLNDRFVEAVSILDPMALVRIYYGKWDRGNDSLSVPISLDDGGTMSAKIPFSALFVRIWETGGMISVTVACVALLIGVLVLKVGFASKELGAYVFFAPLIGAVFIWVLVKIMLAAGYLFGSFLVAGETLAAICSTYPVVGFLVAAIKGERENALTDKLLKRFT